MAIMNFLQPQTLTTFCFQILKSLTQLLKKSGIANVFTLSLFNFEQYIRNKTQCGVLYGNNIITVV